MSRVILFGGSFDPIHKGHIEIAKAALNQRNAKAVWFIPTKMSPFKEDSTVFEHRFKMIQMAISSNDDFYVSDIEATLPSPSYSIDTVKALKKENDGIEFEWLIGSDQLERLNDWKDFDVLEKMVQFIVYNRSNQKLESKYPIIEGSFYDISSTEIRNGISTETFPMVLKYMTEHSLYLKQHLKRRLTQKRYEHVLRVLDLGESLALHHHQDINAVRLAILAHDLCKEDNNDVMKNLMEKVYPKFGHLHPAIYHAFAAAHELSHRYYIKDKRVLKAVRAHVNGESTHPISQIVFIADKCEAGRNYDMSRLVDLAFTNLNLGFKEVKKSAENYRLKRGN